MAAGLLRTRQPQGLGRADLPVGLDARRRVPTAGSRRAGARRSVTLAASILAGGRSSRMGRDKSRLRIGRRTVLAHARQAAKALGLSVRVIRQDIVPRCGPLGGVLTALRTSQAEGELFLACDMPFVSVALLRKLLRALCGSRQAAFTFIDRLAGFPFAMLVECAPVVEAQIAAKEFSLQALAGALRASLVSPPGRGRKETFNINTKADLETARASARGSPECAGRAQRRRRFG